MHVFSSKVNEMILKEIDESDISCDQKIMLYQKWITMLSISEAVYEYCHPRDIRK